MRRVLVIGGNGSGKTTMARMLAERVGLPLCHLDSLYWTDNWKPRGRVEFLELLDAELNKSEWILDGNMRSTLSHRLNYCDTVIYLDFSGIRCFFGTLKRILQYRGKARPDMGCECVERLDIRSLRFVFSTLSFNRKNRKSFYAAIAEHPDVRLIVLKNRRQVKKFLESVKEQCPM